MGRPAQVFSVESVDRPGVVILGAGPAGISAAIALGPDAIVLERSLNIGGLSGTVELDGAVFDVGGHSFHTPHPDVKDLVFSALPMYEQKREARCYCQGSMISYPFQKHFRELPNAEVIQECERGLRNTDGCKTALNFDSYLRGGFGAGISRHFLLPYNRKFWGRDLENLSTEWASQRVAAPAGVRERFESSGGERKPLQHDTTVAYPARGGFGEITKALAGRVRHVRLGTRVTRVDPARKIVVADSGEIFRWDRLISTLPINELLTITDHIPAALQNDASRLKYLSVRLVFAVIGHPVDTAIQRIYTADASIPAHKIVVNHNSSDYLRFLPRHGITGEISYSSEHPLPEGDTEDQFVGNLIDLGLIRHTGEVRRTSAMNVKYAYPVPTLDRGAIVGRLQEWLVDRRIYSIGRFGEWAYINSDEAMHRGLMLGRAIAADRFQPSS